MATTTWKQLVYDFADAVRTLLGTTEKIQVGQLAGKISSITRKSAATYTPSTSAQTIAAGQYLAGAQTIAAMPSGALSDISVSSSGLITGQVGTSGYLASGTKKTKQLTTQAAKTVTPSTSSQTAIASGVYTTGAVTVAGDANLTADNIASGKSIFGITGTHKGPYPNGTSWTSCTFTEAPNSSAQFYKLHYANNIWVGIGYVAGVRYSTDNGKTWNNSNLAYNVSGGSQVGSLYYANNIWVCCLSTGLYYSTDGKTWTQTNITDSVQYGCLSYGNGKWLLASGTTSLAPFYYSTDGKNWTALSPYNIPSSCRAIKYANGMWVIAVLDKNGFFYSTDGTNWSRSNISANVNGSRVEYSEEQGLWVISCSTSHGIYYSTDGKNWTQGNITNQLNYVMYANGVWIAGGSTGTCLAYSTDGKTWTASNVTSGMSRGAYYGNGIWVACAGGLSSSPALSYSTDNGRTWTSCGLSKNYTYAIHYANGMWVAYTKNNILVYSIAWEPY